MKNLWQLLIETKVQANNIICIHLTKNRHVIIGLVDTLKNIHDTVYHDNLAINRLMYARHCLLTLAKIDHRLNQLNNGLRK